MELHPFYQGKRVLVTGGVGSIGNVIVREVLKYDPELIRVFDNNETALFDIEQELQSRRVRPLIGDIRDKERLTMAMEQIDIVFHAAALKHVPICEYNPFDAVKTNVLGTQNVLDAALSQGVGKVISVSTDKAVSPTNVMGATKLLAERLTISANSYRGHKKTTFSCVRFGNVLNSRGSVVPIFLKQIKAGGPVTITHPNMKRFVMDIPSAAKLVLKAAAIAQGREIFILKMPVMRIIDLAEVMIEIYSPRFGYNPADIRIDTIGLRCGEKIDEVLMTPDETTSACESDEMFMILSKKLPYGEEISVSVPEGFREVSVGTYSSDDGRVLTKEEIRGILKDNPDLCLN
jgi:UDP-N-acetylglucosamine 4,6-dehydratase